MVQNTKFLSLSIFPFPCPFPVIHKKLIGMQYWGMRYASESHMAYGIEHMGKKMRHMEYGRGHMGEKGVDRVRGPCPCCVRVSLSGGF